MEEDSKGTTLSNVIRIDNERVRDHLGPWEALARIKGMFRDRVEVEYASRGIADEMAELRVRRRARLVRIPLLHY